jgi:DNA-binding NarL/FixJ family response regulator
MTEPRQPIRTLLVDDDALVRAGLRTILSSADDIEVVSEASDGSQVPDAVRASRPDVVLMDIRMPDVDGVTATARIRAQPRPPQVIVLTTFDLDELVVDALRAGASGFLLKDTPPHDIVRAVRIVASGQAMLSPTVTRRLIEHVADTPAHGRRVKAEAALDSLSDREHEVAVEIGHGRSNAEIAARLYMSEATVKSHVSRLLTKLDASNRVQIAIIVHDAGMV